MKPIQCIVFLLILSVAVAMSQSRSPQNHKRGMLHQTVYNTGELGRAFDGGQTGMTDGFSSMEWPPNSTLIIDGTKYSGQHNSMGAGLYLAGTINGVRQTIACGAVSSSGNGQTVPVAGVYSFPGTITRTENYPVLANGNLNPGYNSFIIYEYDLVNTSSVPITDAFVGWGYALCPSMFGYERLYNEWSESVDMRSKDMYARFDLKRWMSYNQERTGKPDSKYFSLWSQSEDRGGLNSPQAVGFLPLYFDHNHLALKGQSNYPKGADSAYVWDETDRLKQPYTNRYENRNVDVVGKITTWTDINSRKTTAFGTTDSTSFIPTNVNDWAYWKGRAKPSSSLGWKQPVVHAYVFGPY